MRRNLGLAIGIFLLLPGCVFGLGSRGGGDRVVQVDYRNDEFASHYWRYFPGTVDAHPGDTIVFRQQWTGEPHTVTFGQLVDHALPRIAAVDKKYAKYGFSPPPEIAKKAEREYKTATNGIPIFDEITGASAQNAEQPCYLATGAPPTDPRRACSRSQQLQPKFTGRQSFYSSGFIPPRTAKESLFRVRLANGVRPGTYRFYCMIHFPFMQGKLVVKPASAALDTQSQLNARALREITALSRPLEKAFAAMVAGTARSGGNLIPAPIAGYHSGDEFTVAIDSFVPRTIRTKVGQPITWTMVGEHTISFGVPRYVPIYFIRKDGTVRRNPLVDKAAGGSPQPSPVDFTHSTYRIDGGTYDGTGLFSSGLLGSEPFSTYTLRFSKPGRYRYACLVHPPMVGTVIVRR
jgi:plastocyanin